ncbi:WXG100 family type VII secretion target [Rhodococcus sp. ARC_M12]|uniref:ESAT-6-like protein n=1 Tax=Rhodococcus navarretei TaxID=3128981 RepID=A0ABU9CYC6_9NOCA|nr:MULTISPECIES: WXG100 family type VII secretion target [unclassified Rhodococcus (in: high G+C Gram-positive bacteria)]MCJ0890752.1 WXG100 family type VII secretion target [Rhodococcus sp. ARC_M5]MCJ0977975.1 WXG100 family type VII secretion target [Rhodococcus sp. ARC_M12]
MKYDFAQIAALTEAMNKQANVTKDLLADVDTTAKRLYESWEGDAMTSYYELQRQWNSASDELNLILSSLVAAARTGGETMHGVEMANKARMAR